MEELVSKIEKLIAPSKGTWGIVLEDLNSGEKWEHNEQELFYAASVIKVPIMASVYSAVESGDLALTDLIILDGKDYVGGSGVLQHFTPGLSLPLQDIIMLMIIQSDNTATNLLIDLIGVVNIQNAMKEAGMVYSTFYNKLMLSRSNPKGANRIAAVDIATLLHKMATGDLVSDPASGRMVDVMKKQQVRDCLPEKLPSPYSDFDHGMTPWELANKTGWIPGTRHDVGIFYVGDRKFIATILSKDEDDLLSKRIISQIGEEIYKYLQ
ncbi:serine hydrolase [Psychrobacillus sp. INOP01]|uniref:serine hydrolase n=1 Tax=Psychrobacillus sp. INOP01 TaxID=2829187 RepID=UPI001BA9EAB2|nr:serine hydrolase [Psychrobacillus sp. INOP01]QUG43595.1 serine hydrolase [Psychrobacillus sp. INOP01]